MDKQKHNLEALQKRTVILEKIKHQISSEGEFFDILMKEGFSIEEILALAAKEEDIAISILSDKDKKAIQEEQERIKKRRREFKRDQERRRFEQALQERKKIKKDNFLFSYKRKDWIKKKEETIITEKDRQMYYDQERKAKSIALDHNLDLSVPSASRLMLWQKEVADLKAQFRKGNWGRGSQIKESAKNEQSSDASFNNINKNNKI